MEWLQFRGGKEVNVKHRGTNKIPESLVRVFRTGCDW